MKPKFFKSAQAFRKWLEKNHDTKKELYVGYYKTGSGKSSITWPESVDQALCFGWIDGIRRSVDDNSYMNRFTPRKPGSNWSAINIQKVKDLTKKGLMHPSGLEAFKKRKENRSAIYTYENAESEMLPEYEKLLKANKKAWKYFQSLAPSYKRLSKYWIMSAKQESTRRKRLNQLISDCAASVNQWKDNKYKKK